MSGRYRVCENRKASCASAILIISDSQDNLDGIAFLYQFVSTMDLAEWHGMRDETLHRQETMLCPAAYCLMG